MPFKSVLGAYMKEVFTAGLTFIFSVFFITACSSLEGEGGKLIQSQAEGVRGEFYLVSDRDRDSALTSVSYMGQSLQLRQPAVIGNKDIASVEPHGPSSLLLQLTPAGGEKLFAATSHHIGHRMHIMLDGEVVNVATIRMGLGAKMVNTGLNERQYSTLLTSFIN